MSLEGLLLLALFILLPLIERLLRAARRPEGDAPIPPPAPRRQAPIDAPAALPADSSPEPAGPAPRRPPRPPLAATGPPRAVRRAGSVEELRTPLALRRAVVLATILGPCRAVAPHEWTSPRQSDVMSPS